MKRAHRRFHGLLWPLLMPALVALVVVLTLFRGPGPITAEADSPDTPEAAE